MRRVLVVLLALLALAPAAALAQGRTYVPFQAFTTTSTGTTFTTPLLLPDGSAAAPALAFANDTTLGVWRGGANYLTLTSGGQVRLQSGTAASAAFILSANGALGSRLKIGQGSLEWTASNADATTDVVLVRDAANTLALRNGTNPQTFNIYNTYTDASNYERGVVKWDANLFTVGVESAGSGSNRALGLLSGGGLIYWNGSTFYFSSSDSYDFGRNTNQTRIAYVSRGIQGSKTKALTEGSPTTVATVAVPQTAGSNFAAGEVLYTVYASDGTDTQTLNGSAFFSAVNKAGTEACQLTDDQIGTEAASAGTLVCTVACATGLTDVVGITFDCTSSLTQTSLNALVRFDMQQPNTVTPQ